MMLFHLAGHSGAGKSRLISALPNCGIKFPRSVLYTSRTPREGEVHGRDYYFLSKGAIADLPRNRFFVGPVREMLQAVDLDQLQEDLESKKNDLVLIEIFADLWPELSKKITERAGSSLHTRSVFMTAVDPEVVRALPNRTIRTQFIRNEVERILTWRGKDRPEKIASRATSAGNEVLVALGLDGDVTYDRVLHSSPEGPDSQDEWTREKEPVGRAKEVLDQVVALIKAAAGAE